MSSRGGRRRGTSEDSGPVRASTGTRIESRSSPSNGGFAVRHARREPHHWDRNASAALKIMDQFLYAASMPPAEFPFPRRGTPVVDRGVHRAYLPARRAAKSN